MANNKSTTEKNHSTPALVIGAGIAGLITARVLSDHYEQVLIVERDTFPDAVEPRTGTPQAFHVHRILPRGKMILEQLFPGYIDDLLSAGAYPIQNKAVTMVKPTGIFHSLQPDRDVSCSRALLEWELRQRVQALPGIRFLSNREVTGLHISSDHKKVTGLTLRERGQVDQQTIISANLIVDASGRTSKLGQWLQELGFTLPGSEQIHSAIGYSTRFYKASEQTIEKVGTIIVDEMEKEETLGVGILPIENDTLWVTIFGTGERYPSTTVAGYDKELANLHLVHSELADEIKKTEPLTTPRGYRVPVCVRNHYEETENWPAGLLVIGDAFCHFDPIYGQGMTIAAIEASILASILKEEKNHPQPNLERRILARMQEAIAPAWWLSVINDLRASKVTYEGKSMPQGAAFFHCYMDLYFKYALEHPVANEEVMSSPLPTVPKFLLLNGLIVPPPAIFNTPTLNLLLEKENSSEGPHRLRELVEELHIEPDKIIETLLPTFTSTDVFPVMGQQ